jgi:cysteinyl-tRNA synthetase
MEPIDHGGGQCGVYCCGPTVYGPAHIGNFRTFVTVDLLVRTLTLAGNRPFFVRNITDIDDKTITGAQAAGKSLADFTNQWTERFHRDCAALNLLAPNREPSATTHIKEQIDLIGRLLGKGIAYEREGSVYFSIAAWPQYGRLSLLAGRELRGEETSFTKDAVEDFVLWKAAKESDVSMCFPSPWGLGRPGWHIECSAMANCHLGPNFAIHCGGIDLLFPHHENEIAQSEAATGLPLAQLWLHINHLHLGGEKMSKSLGNLHTLADITAAGHGAETIRLALLASHYRQILNFADNSPIAAGRMWDRLREFGENLQERVGDRQIPMAEEFFLWNDVWEAVLDDLNLPKAMGLLLPSLRSGKFEAERAWAEWQRMLFLLGLRQPEGRISAPPAVEALAEKRRQARQRGDFATADMLRQELLTSGWTVRDGEGDYKLFPTDESPYSRGYPSPPLQLGKDASANKSANFGQNQI